MTPVKKNLGPPLTAISPTCCLVHSDTSIIYKHVKLIPNAWISITDKNLQEISEMQLFSPLETLYKYNQNIKKKMT